MILSEIKNGVLTLTLNRPEKYNSFNTEMSKALQEGLDLAAQNNEVRCVVITGSGKGFCAGQDLGEFPNPKEIDFEKIIDNNYNPLILKIRSLQKPVIAAVNGIAAGAGASLALACDIILATESAYFTQAFSKISLIPDSGATWFLPRLIGKQRAAALMFTADKISAQEAENMGMIYKSYEDAAFLAAVENFAEQMAQMPTKGLALTKNLLNQSFDNNLEQQLEYEKQMQIEAGQTHDFKEGISAFLEKRKPIFKGE